MALTRRKTVVLSMAVIILAVPVMFCWWWVQWPVWTMNNFIQCARAHNFDACNPMLQERTNLRGLVFDVKFMDESGYDFQIHPRSTDDIIHGRAWFDGIYFKPIRAEFGRIILHDR